MSNSPTLILLTIPSLSKPLKNSFIHTGHGDPTGESWGDPGKIDEMYLKNPLEAPDILGTPEPPSPLPTLKGKKGSMGKSGECLTR